MIILNTINHENNKIEYHFAHDDFNGSVFKIISKFDVTTDENEDSYIVCEYDQLEHHLVSEINEIDCKRACDEFCMATLQSLLEKLKHIAKGGDINDCK